MKNYRYLSFHSIKGIEIKTDNTFEKFLFSNFTFLSNDEIFDLIKTKKFQNIKDDEERYNYIINNLKFLEYQNDLKSDSIIVIGTYENPLNHGIDRAKEIIAGLSIIMLLQSNFNRTCCLIDDLNFIHSRLILTLDTIGKSDSETEGFAIESKIISTPNPPEIYSRSELKDLFHNDFFNNFSRFIKRDKKLDKETNNIVLNAAIQIYNSTNITKPEQQILYCITAIEILLNYKTENNKYEKIQHRLENLIGSEAYHFYNDKFKISKGQNQKEFNLFDLRHKIIHEGFKVPKVFGIVTLRLSVFTILQYCNECIKFKTKVEFISYLDTKIFLNEIYKNSSFSDLLLKWSKINIDGVIIDPLPFFIYNYYLNDGMDKMGFRRAFYRAVHTYSKVRKMKLLESFNLLNTIALTKHKCFKSYSEFENYIPEFTINIDEDIDIIKKFSWYFNKYNM